MKVWIEDNITSTNNKKFVLVDLLEIIDTKRCRIRKEDGSISDYLISYHEKGLIIDSMSNRALINEIRKAQNVITSSIEFIEMVGRNIERNSMEEIENDPNF